ncbi:DUF998 domain-containing protein [Desulforamulus ruminis]|uniref:DUF998 domain-containing protein n=1 Tax=Desulforamulus ruminis (strain ATCC 23193 / DSM 2154 / NCIMB 8452 / DL) TaxID=696281 RepID=F6DLA1_DESRL|nr:DUF998 domain-containing protein [Desulforamulus ruminis]AEG59322.1 hypothetical protein Desru_1047 [Desulforamulus ruminis DSM 2154]
MKKPQALLGVLAPLVYLWAVILGGLLQKDYSHVTQAISELTTRNAPYKVLLDGLFTIYNFFIIFFGVLAFLSLKKFNLKSLMTSMILLSLTGVFGLLMGFFPMDKRGSEATWQGILHIILAGILSPTTLLVLLLSGLGFRRVKGLEGFAAYSLWSAFGLFITGILAAFSAANGFLLTGLLERLTIGAFLQWITALSLQFYRKFL